MKRLLNTLFVTTQGAWVAKDGQNAVVKVEGEERMRVPLHGLGSMVCFGQVSVSPFLMAACAEDDVCVSFMTENGRFLARVQGAARGNVLLRRRQYRGADDPGACALAARSILTGKIANSRYLLLRRLRENRDRVDQEAVLGAAATLKGCLERLPTTGDLDRLRGLEGEAAAAYFGAFGHLILESGGVFVFAGRNRRPPLDPVNCLLSFAYTLLMHDVRGALESVGLDPYVGYLHRDRPGRPGLALDLMEELRPVAADRLVLSLINTKAFGARDFRTSGSGAVLLDDDARKEFLVAWQRRKQQRITHPFLREDMEFGLVPLIQARLFAAHVRGELEAYPPFVWR